MGSFAPVITKMIENADKCSTVFHPRAHRVEQMTHFDVLKPEPTNNLATRRFLYPGLWLHHIRQEGIVGSFDQIIVPISVRIRYNPIKQKSGKRKGPERI